jgi:four helix bundle protein
MPFRFEGLEIWQMAREYSDAICKIAARFPGSERYSLSSQITRAANSIALNIAEGSGRDTNAYFNCFLSIALGSTLETASALFMASDRGYLDKSSFDELYDQADKLGRTITNFRRSLNSRR